VPAEVETRDLCQLSLAGIDQHAVLDGLPTRVGVDDRVRLVIVPRDHPGVGKEGELLGRWKRQRQGHRQLGACFVLGAH
jgi:hypothetical protein